MKKITFYDLILKKRLFGLAFLLLLSNMTFAQTFCRPTSHSIGNSGLCIGSGITDPAFAYDAESSAVPTTATTLSTVVGVVCTLQETLIFNQTAKAGDQIVLYIGSGDDILDLGLFSTATIEPFLGTVSAGDKIALGSSILNLSLLSGDKIGVIRYTLTQDANRVVIKLGGGLVGVLNTLRIYDARLQFAKPTIVGGETQSVCTGQSIALSATAAAGTTVAWYDSPTSTTALSAVSSFTTPALTASKTYYVSTSRVGGCESDQRTPVTVNVIEPALPTISTAGTAICSSGATQATTLSVINPVLGTDYKWYDAETGGNLLTPGNTYAPTVPTGITKFYVEASIGSCKTTRTTVTVTSTPVPANPTVLTQSVSILSGQNATLNAFTNESGVTFDWYDVVAGGTKLLGGSDTFTTPILIATKTFYVEARNSAGGCVSALRVPITVTVTAAQGSCLQANSQQTSQSGLCLLCGSLDQNKSVDGDNNSAARLTVPVGLVNDWVQQILQFNNAGQAGDVITVELGIPGGLADVGLLTYISLATYNGATFNNDRKAVNSLLNVQLLSGGRFRVTFEAKSSFDRVEIRLGGLALLLTSLDIYGASYKFKERTITGNKTICSGQTTTLTADVALGESIKWYDAATAGNLLSSAAAFTTPALTANTTYYVEVTRNGCVNSERSAVLVTVNNPVAPAINSTITNICAGGSAVLSVVSAIAGTTYNWYDATTGGSLIFTGISYSTPNLIATTSYYVEAVIGNCSSTRTQKTINVNPLPSVPVPVSSNVTIQSGQSVQLAVVDAGGTIKYNWFDVPSGGISIELGSSTFTPSPALTASKTFYVEAVDTASDCKSSPRAVINVSVINTVDICLRPTIQQTSLDGAVCIVPCGVTDPDFSVDGDNTTAAKLSFGLGILSTLEQKLIFTTTGQAGDIIDVELGLPGGIVDLGLVSNVTLRSFNGATPNNDLTTIGALVNVQLLGGNRFKASFVAGGSFSAIQVKLGGLANIATSLDIYGASYRFKEAAVSGTTVCVGKSANLAVTSDTTGKTYKWYNLPTGGTELSALSTYTTLALNTSTTYYLEETRGTCVNSTRQAVTVNIVSVPTAGDILISSPLTTSCTGGIVLSPTSSLAGAKFNYYFDQNKTQPVPTGNVAGVTYSKDVAGALTISGLTSSTTYFISVVNEGSCENETGTLKEVVVNYAPTPALTVSATLSGCAKVNLKDAIASFDTSGNTTYTFYSPINTQITDEAAVNITASGDYWIQAQTKGNSCLSAKQKVTVTINQIPTLTDVTTNRVVNKGEVVTLNATSNAAITWYDPQGNALPSNSTGALNTVGVYTYTVIVNNGTCTNSQTVTISVIDPLDCDTLLERVYANEQSYGSILTGGVSNEALAVDGNPSTYSTITTGFGLLGIGTTWQNLQWPKTISKGTPVTVKLGLENSLIAVGQSITVVGTKRDGLGNPIDIGTLQSVSGSLVNLLSGQNSFEYTFVPSDISGTKDYDGIRVQLGSVLSVGQSINVYDAHYKKQVKQITCGQGDIEDIFSGVRDLGVGALTTTVGVSQPWNVADGDVGTYATMFSGAGVLAAAELTTAFRTPSMVGDSLRIVISKPGTILNLNLLTGFVIQLYSGNIEVGAPIKNDSNLLSLKLLSGDTMAMTILAPQTQPYDRVRISLGGVASVFDQLRVHSIDRVTNTKVIGSDIKNTLTVCPGSELKLEVAPKNCSTYAWYDSPTGGNVLANGQSYTLPAAMAAGTYKYYIQPIRYGCPALTRGVVTVVVRATTPAATIASIKINNGSNTVICSENGNVSLEAVLVTPLPTLTNPVYYWYSFDGTKSNLIPGKTTSTLNVTGLSPGTYTYYVGLSSDEYCETAPGDRKQVTFTILPTSLPTDISVNNDSVCHNTTATLTPSSSLVNPVFFWYLDANKTKPILTGLIDGVTYTVDNVTGVLTASGLTAAMSPMTYYAAVKSDNTCPNKAGELKEVTVTVTDPATPTTDDNTQDFCVINSPKVSDLKTNEADVVWYDSATSTTPLLASDPLTSKIYYGVFSVPIKLNPTVYCESKNRLAITVTVTDPGTPNISDKDQDFCLVNAPTIASINVSPETGNIVWYDASTGGNVVTATTALTTKTYYAALKDATTTCESNVRLAVAVNVTDPGTPDITDKDQDFCLVNAPTIANINVSPETGNIVWYDALTGGNLVTATTALTTKTYYAALKNATTTCESNVRLAVAVNVTDPGTPNITDKDQDFCLVNAPTIASINVSPETGNIVWYDALTGGNVVTATTALTTKTYYAALKGATTTCESNVRLAVAVNVTDPGTPNITDKDQDFCLVNAPTIASINVSPETGNIVWYDALTGGNVVTATTALTTKTYYAALKNATTTCESNVRLAVAVNVTDPGTPNITDKDQDFCLINASTIASINVSPETGNIVWYDALTGGNVVTAATALTTKTYYAALKDATTTCESNVRLAVAVNVTDPGTPNIADKDQDFCLVNTPTIANINVSPETGNIIWYDALTGGNVVTATTALTTRTYYAALKDATTTCESNVRLAVAVNVTDPGTPNISDKDQDFCLVNAPTIASINVSPETGNIVWYDALTGGNVVTATTALITKTYYAALKNATTTCESNVRLAVAVNVTDPGTPNITDKDQDFCLINAPTIANINVSPETGNIVWYDALTGGNVVTATTALTTRTYYAALKNATTTCESNVRLAVAVNVTDPGTPNIADKDQDFCLVNTPTIASINVSPETGNIVWYDALTGGNVVTAATALTTRTYYAALKNATTTCESNVRLAVVINVTDPGTPNIADKDQDFCVVNAPTFASINVSPANNVVWYTNLVGGNLIPAGTTLTTGTYYAAIKDPVTSCESNTRLPIAIKVTDPVTPTTTSGTQVFCSGNNPTVASIQVNESNVIWYNAAIGGTAIASTAPLVNGDYFAALKDAVTGCESSNRLKVTVTVGNSITPTTNNAAQEFCSTTAPTIASIKVNESNVSWFNVPVGGTAITATTALTSGIYYGEITDAATGCKSATRLKVTITVTTPSPTPTTTDTTQDFCSTASPTIASIQVNEANVIWYNTQTGGTAIPASTALATGTYYGAAASTTNCENPNRLAVAVTVNTPGRITTPRTAQVFCLAASPTLANIQVNEANVVWYSTPTGGAPLTASTLLTATTYYADALINITNGCGGASRLGVTVSFENDALVPITTNDDTPCVFQGVTYSIANGKSNYVWSVTNGTIINGGGTSDDDVTISWSDIGPGKVQVTYINTCNETTTKTLSVTVATCSDITITNTVDNPTPNFGDHVTFTVTVNNVGQGSFINTIVSELLPSGYDLVSSSTTIGVYDPKTQLWTIPTLNSGQSATLTIVAEVLPSGNYLNVATIEISTPLDVDASNNSASASVDPICLTVYNEFTPNNDGANDLFRIDCIESYPNNELKVYNRYGALVYSKQHYENDWNGTANVSGVINRGDMLPTGTYFYVITIGDGTVKKGWLSIMR
ncbi:gliding motility-associated C-terminal domain-containing protein [Flavobacterium plurextorum]|uniref:Ig-like domain-containing protein n=1 Tax=Flavobacterium TaxID=237 RepID=UPI00214D67F6|nr:MULTISPECIES: gliding motility-associated C-terminal domain-containing protein [Flavobacterium]UUW07351.1 gliding motility-associated C-terminal domain-containing protein [Flavobacterium plurextorum]